ncbi:hypothetical protein QTO34_006869 [Cnephaeus nilssonii]|uniref:Peptidase A2 domain-containing protein n=1 Tax=Cnephaeus nilssonii TaxID=3371016 RepID=A0AA40HJ68_CNENI|nr:hypothetical protein QTO34_006869 [Eptesicus nilssonii]
MPVYYNQPFTISDILNWKHHTPAYSEKPQAMVDLLETIFQTQKPTWMDCKQLLFTFFNNEEHMRVVSEARKWLQTQAPAGILDTDRWAREGFPDEEPDWNPNSEDGRARLERCRLAFLQGVRAGAKKPTNMAKISEVFQKPDESLSMRDYVRPRKIELWAARKEEEKRIQKRANIIAVAFRGLGSQTDQKGKQEYRSGGEGRESLRRDQCAYCKETGHWKNECPKRQRQTGSFQLGPHEPMVRMKIGGQTVDIMVDTGAEHSVVIQKVAPLSGKTRRPFCHPRRCQLGGHQVIHEFLYLPDCPVPLMGRDVLAKMGAEITFAPDGSAQLRLSEETSPTILSLAVRREEEWRLYTPQTKASPLEPELEEEFLLIWA